MKKIVTFDFDDTLTLKVVQDYVKTLIILGVEVYVLTSRYDELHKHRFPHNPTNNDLYKIINKVGIDINKIRFQCMRPKHEYLYNSNVIWHLDDDFIEIEEINSKTDTIGIDVSIKGWKDKCDKLLEL